MESKLVATFLQTDLNYSRHHSLCDSVAVQYVIAKQNRIENNNNLNRLYLYFIADILNLKSGSQSQQ